MNAKDRQFRNDGNSAERGKDLSGDQVKELDLAGGVEGGMPAGSAGGPGQSDVEDDRSERAKHRPDR